jgi:hypothetical protein
VLTQGDATKEEVTLSPDSNRNVVIQFAPTATEALIIKDGLNGAERRRTTVMAGGDLTTSVNNSNADATVFDLEVKSDPKPILIALPGAEPTAAKVGQGTLEEFARALAGYYRVPVEVHVAKPTFNVSWEFKAPDAQKAAIAALDLQQFTIVRTDKNLIVISES